MPLTAMWFLLAGGILVVAGLVPAALGRGSEVGLSTFIGLGLLTGPAVYLGLSVLHWLRARNLCSGRDGQMCPGWAFVTSFELRD